MGAEALGRVMQRIISVHVFELAWMVSRLLQEMDFFFGPLLLGNLDGRTEHEVEVLLFQLMNGAQLRPFSFAQPLNSGLRQCDCGICHPAGMEVEYCRLQELRRAAREREELRHGGREAARSPR